MRISIRFCIGLAFGFGLWTSARAQDGDLLLNDDVYPLIDRLATKGVGPGPFHLEQKPYPREWVAEWLAGVDTTRLTRAEKGRLSRALFLTSDSVAAERPTGVFRYVFRNRRDLLGYVSPKARVYLNPALYASLGQSKKEGEGSVFTYRNSRGVTLRGALFGKVGFYADFFDTQARYPQFINERIQKYNIIWGEGFYKTFGVGGYDFLSAKGYLTYSPIKAIRIKLGWDRAFIGAGMESLLLSDYSPDYLQLTIRTRISKKFEYVNHFTQFIDYFPGKPDNWGAFPRKYGAFHTLTFLANKSITLGLFEGVIYGARQPNASRGLELQYLNPIIFYRTVEQYIGSPDNAMLGANGRFHLFRRLQVYGQLALDDYNLAMRKTGAGWWGNKIGYQVGFKWADAFFIPNLDIGFEYNSIRPYTYSHYSTASNYANYGQPLAHAFGANLIENAFSVRYQPLAPLAFVLQGGFVRQGLDTDGKNYGSEIERPMLSHNNGTTNPDFNNVTLQGKSLRALRLDGRLTYQLFRLNAYFDVEGGYRADEIDGVKKTNVYFSTTLRYQLPVKPLRF